MDNGELLNKMAPRVRYELDKVIDFLVVGNHRTGVLRPEIDKLTQESILKRGADTHAASQSSCVDPLAETSTIRAAV